MLYTVDEICRIRYECEKPTQAQRNTITRMCQDGTILAHKFGRTWLIEIPLFSEQPDYDKLANMVVEKIITRFGVRRKEIYEQKRSGTPEVAAPTCQRKKLARPNES